MTHRGDSLELLGFEAIADAAHGFDEPRPVAQFLSLERTIDVHVRSLRQKLGDKARFVETVRGIGYRFKAE